MSSEFILIVNEFRTHIKGAMDGLSACGPCNVIFSMLSVSIHSMYYIISSNMKSEWNLNSPLLLYT